MNPKFIQLISVAVITLIFLGSFTNPTEAKADFLSGILGSFGVGSTGSYNGQYGSSSYGYNDGTSGEHNGDLEITKEARRIGRDDKYHDKIRVRTGELVEVRIEVKNKSSINTAAVVRDELGGSVVYVKNSLRGVPAGSQGSLTSGGMQINVPAKTTVTIFYQFNVCGASGYVTRAYAYAANIGSATDGLLIEMENYDNNVYFDEVSICMNQLQNVSATGNNNVGSTSFTSGNPFGGWTGVNNATATNSATSNPFTGWTGVNNANQTTTTNNNAFGTWTGVNNSDTVTNNSTSTNSVFGTWTGVNNSGQVSNPFGDWVGGSATTNTSNDTSSTNITNTFGSWTGVNNSGQASNPFGDWTGTQSTSTGYDASGYSSGVGSMVSNNSDFTITSESSNRPIGSTVAYESTNSSTTNFVAPTTGVNPWAPFSFAGLLTAGFLAFRNRKFLFN